ncbi:Arylsulfatase [Arcticibacter svalbardensis MN12-7]|uniref:Arylsulfatase n=1 Tax=Arcticibacter svalbardensis MN12-7 TaxID=1150600 RepID=R9GQ26_9SPHI|nr:arylsulfatase [Arcticibacter svalbardensis]EOR93813.1 Arylsulfatase [Arcticibacter svalbardensis MN12-7]
MDIKCRNVLIGKKKNFYSCLFICTVGGFFSCNVNNNQEVPKQKPNIIYILSDDMGYGDLGCYGQKTIKTPNIDKMASEGIIFTQHYAGSSVCAPSRASLMTGRDNGHCRVRGNYETGTHGFGGELELRPQDTTIPEILKNAGYTTALIGKWGLGMDGTTGEPNKKGFDYSNGYLNQAHAHSQYPDYLFKNGVKYIIPANANGKRNKFSNDIFTTDAIRYIKESKSKEQPFFMFLSFVTPHAEMLVPEDEVFQNYKKKFKETPYTEGMGGSNGKDSLGIYHSQNYPEAAFASMITHIDNDVAKVLKLLKDLNLDENTVVMFASDNGPHEEGGNNPYYFNSNSIFKGIKRDLYEGGIRVPFIVRWPNVIKPKIVTSQICAFWDIMPTLGQMAHADMSGVQTEGISLMPTLLGDTANQKQHDHFYWEFHENKYSDQAVRKGDWKAVRHDPSKASELYNIKIDPEEKNNVETKHPNIVKEFEQLMISSRVDNPYFKLKRSSSVK